MPRCDCLPAIEFECGTREKDSAFSHRETAKNVYSIRVPIRVVRVNRTERSNGIAKKFKEIRRHTAMKGRK